MVGHDTIPWGIFLWSDSEERFISLPIPLCKWTNRFLKVSRAYTRTFSHGNCVSPVTVQEQVVGLQVGITVGGKKKKILTGSWVSLSILTRIWSELSCSRASYVEGEKDLRASDPGVPEARALMVDRFKCLYGPFAKLRSSTICCLIDMLSATSCTCFRFHSQTVSMSPP